MKYLSFLLALSSFSCMAQNYVPDNGEIINRGNLNLNTIVSSNKWTTTRNATAGKFSNYGAGKFTDGTSTPLTVISNPAKWIDGYVKHYAITNYTSHVYPVGSATECLFVSTSGEIESNAIAIAWVSGAYNVSIKDADIKTVSSTGRWSWITSSSYTGSITATVKVPGGITGGSHLKLIGWNGTKWITLADNAYSGMTLTGKVPSNITALGIGSTTTITNFKNPDPEVPVVSSEEPDYFRIYPNPAKSRIITLAHNLAYSGRADVLISDASGKTVLKTPLNLVSGKNSNTLNIQKLPGGIFTVQLLAASGETLTQPQKLIVP